MSKVKRYSSETHEVVTKATASRFLKAFDELKVGFKTALEMVGNLKEENAMLKKKLGMKSKTEHLQKADSGVGGLFYRVK